MQTNKHFVTLDGTPYYKIENSEKLAPFFIQVVSSSDIWIFLSSIADGGLTAGRKNAEHCIFPYETEDKLRTACNTGCKTIIKAGGKFWQPFEQNGTKRYAIQRNIYKSCYGDSVIMEERNQDLGLIFSYKLQSSERYGIVKTSSLCNVGDCTVQAEILDGFTNILPYGVNLPLQNNSSTLIDAYKATELEGRKLAVYSLTTTVNDIPYPIEMLKANIAYCTLTDAEIHLDSDVICHFTNTDTPLSHKDACYGKKGAYLAVFQKELCKDIPLQYSFVLDCAYDHCKLAEIEPFANGCDFTPLYEDIRHGTSQLVKLVADADGIQNTADTLATSSHFVNTLYNLMRGGAFEDGYWFDYDLFLQFVAKRNQPLYQKSELLQKARNCKTIMELKDVARCDVDFYRLALEFMPLSFSRRHGDPSRPWNKFNISLKNENGAKISGYEGNWRDIFQNWEALGLSYPAYYENMVAKFVNATTVDGFNPYRISQDGIDWEKPEPDNPFSGLGYWGDHQIIYLLRLLKGLHNHYPEKIQELLTQEIFSYANVPYILKDYDEIVKNSKSTLVFDQKKDSMIESTCKTYGTDAKLLLEDGAVYTANLAEKLLVPALCKISNLLPGGGIWMNTERPEWNDANNAIVGIGLSVITVYHLKAYLVFVRELFSGKEGVEAAYSVSQEVSQLIMGLCAVLNKYKGNIDENEKNILDGMGKVFSHYRKTVQDNGFCGKQTLKTTDIKAFIESAMHIVDYTIQKNKGDVFVSYNLLKDDFSYSPMKTMLEGQSAALASGVLPPKEVCTLINAMEKDLYCKEAGYHTLYPVQKTRRFTKKNNISNAFTPIEGILVCSKNNTLHFAPQITTEKVLVEKCANARLTQRQTDALCAEYERVFAHKRFNGRSDVIYKFEGIGCAYWHQNAKFALGVLEAAQKAGISQADFDEIYAAYNRLLQGFIYRKSPSECGAIPIEPYSHTSYNMTSEQPGMTGQVKESILMRRGELGVMVKNGEIHFAPKFLRPDEFCENGELTFHFCGTKITYKKSQEKGIKIHSATPSAQAEYSLNREISRRLFHREKSIDSIEVLV